MSASRLWKISVSLLYYGSTIALALLVLGLLTGATEVARNFAALLETQVRQQLWSALLENPLAWVCLASALAVAAIIAGLTGCLVSLHPLLKQIVGRNARG